MTLTDLSSFAIGSLLMFLIMAMVSIDNVGELADLVLEMDGSNLCIMQLGICWISLARAPVDCASLYIPLSFSRRDFILVKTCQAT